MPVLWCWPITTCSRRVLVVLHELGMRHGVDYELRTVPLAKGAHKTPEHVERQPFGKVPVWQEGDWLLFESRAICAHLVATYGAESQTLLPSGRARATMEQWISVEHSELYGPLMKVYFEKVLKPMKGLGQTDDAAVADSRKALATPLGVLDAHLASGPYLGGGAVTLADLGYLPYLTALCDAGSGDLIAVRPALAAWWARISSRASWQATLAMKSLAKA